MRKFVDKSKIGWEYATIVELLRDRALHQPESEAFTFLKDEGSTREILTYQQLDRRSRAIAMRLQVMGMIGIAPSQKVGLCVERSLENVSNSSSSPTSGITSGS
jgi:acyl-CoA synthetase (AMP-forming)/AMP-acid ligase II